MLFRSESHCQAQEYFHLASFALACCIPELIFSENFTYRLPGAYVNQIYVFLLTLKTITAMNLGLAFSRAKPHWMWTNFLAVGSAATCFLVLIPPDRLVDHLRRLTQAFLPTAFFLSAMACLYQLRQLQQLRAAGT